MGELTAVILAAGKGTRMKSRLPKVLFPVAGKPMLQHIVDTLHQAGVTRTHVVVGYQAEQVQASIQGDITWAYQQQQLGTGHALAQAAEHLRGCRGNVVVVNGDIPLLTADSITAMVDEHNSNNSVATVLSAKVPDPTGYGRIVRADSGVVQAIVEQKDASPRQRAIDEINSGAYCFNWSQVGPLLARLSGDNAQGEYYLTDVFSILAGQGLHTDAYTVSDYSEVAGINDRIQLAQAEKQLRWRIRNAWMEAGVTMVDPDTVWIDAEAELGRDTVIYPNTHILGCTQVGQDCELGPNTSLTACSVGNGVVMRYSVAEKSIIGDGTVVGPFAYMRRGTQLGQGVKVGDFVEIKNSQVGDGVKIPHHAYVGDAEIGSKSNIGCGVITANYDGNNKHKTVIGEEVFVGSNSNLVAPVKIEDGAYIAAGSTITADVPAGCLAIARSRQAVKTEWRKKD